MRRLSKRRQVLKWMMGALASGGIASIPVSRALSSTGDAKVYDAIIVGAGVSGLTASWLLRDLNILVLEAADYAGGRALSGEYNGWRYPKGTEYLGAPEGVFAEMIDALGLTLHQIPAPMDSTYSDGRFYHGFGQKAARLAYKGGRGAYNRLLETLHGIYEIYEPVPNHDPSGPLARLDTISCRQWFEEMELPQVYHDTYNVMSRGLFGATIDEVSALGAFEEIAFDFEGATPLLTQEQVDEIAVEISESGAYTFAHGIAEFTTAVGRALGNKLKLQTPVAEVSGSGDQGYSVVYQTPSGEKVAVEANSVILATPTPITTMVARTILTDEQREILQSVPYAPYITAAVFSDDPIYDQGFDLALPNDFFFTDLYDCTWVQRRVDPAAKAYKGHVASFYIPPQSYREPGFIDRSEEDIILRCKADLERVFPGRAKRIIGHDIHLHPFAYPVPVIGQFGRLTRLHETLTGGMQLAGDGVIYPTFQTAITAGEIAAGRIREYLMT